MILPFPAAGPPESVLDWTREHDTEITNQNASDQVFSRKHWRLVRCQNGMIFFLSPLSLVHIYLEDL